MTLEDQTQEEYDERFSEEDKEKFMALKIKPTIANSYPPSLDATEIAMFSTAGINPKKSNTFLSLKESILYRLYLANFRFVSASYLNAGKEGLIIRQKSENSPYEDVACKFSKNAEYEFNLLLEIKKACPYARHIIRLPLDELKNKGDPKMIDKFSFEMQFIAGDSLEDVLQKKRFSSNQILFVGLEIVLGLIEMRRAGIWYHRDIRPGNIIYDDQEPRVVISDLGIASADRRSPPTCNRRFGGPNDLTSLGQIMYHMATGRHIFDQSQSMSLTFDSVADEINDYRTKVYQNQKLLQKHLDQVDKNIPNQKIRDLTKACLTARRGQYKQMQRMFERYLK